MEMALIALEDELFSKEIYYALSKFYRGELKKRLLKLSRMERDHANFFTKFLEKRGIQLSIKTNRFKISIYTFLLRILGIGLTLRILEMGERGAIKLYSKMLEDSDLSDDEKIMLKKILEDELLHEEELVKEESKFEEFLNHIKEAVLGMNDGLVEILSVTTGLVGAYGSPFHVALGGFIVGTAGALSMGIGAYASARAQRQVHEGILHKVKIASKYVASIFRDRIFSYMREKGYSKSLSKNIAEESFKNKKLLSKIIAEEEYGLREEALESPFKSGIYTGLFYMIGAFVPLIPYFLGLPIFTSLVLSLIFAVLALSVTGFLIAISANLSIRRKIVEMIFFGLGSAGITFIIGRVASILFGLNIS
ncbi:MAG: rubrerythrin family protein [Thermoprotei archaeon]|nr:MAG: rubrerythrin family protein [Thermoprotei archaeon]